MLANGRFDWPKCFLILLHIRKCIFAILSSTGCGSDCDINNVFRGMRFFTVNLFIGELGGKFVFEENLLGSNSGPICVEMVSLIANLTYTNVNQEIHLSEHSSLNERNSSIV